MENVLLLLLGVGIGAYGTLIGAGGGFILMPLLILMYPARHREVLTAVSLAVVFCNALSGTVAYARMRRIHYRAGLIFSAATIPGAMLGAWSTAFLPRGLFDALFGVLLVAASVVLVARPLRETQPLTSTGASEGVVPTGGEKLSYNVPLGVALSAAVGFVSSLFGIGGGIVHVPVLVLVLGFPVHTATATSHFMLAIMALAGTSVHLARGSLRGELWLLAMLAAGVVVGAQLGAALSRRLAASWIVRALAVGLVVLGLRILAGAVHW
jgi:uncharacterized membrane protein YfcA